MKQSGCRGTLHFWHRQIDLPPQCLQWQYFNVPIWYQASHCLQHFVETSVTLQAYFFQKMPELSWQSIPLWNSNTPTFCFYAVQKIFHAFTIEAFTAYSKKSHHHFFDLMQTQYVETNWWNRSTTPIYLLQSSIGVSICT